MVEVAFPKTRMSYHSKISTLAIQKYVHRLYLPWKFAENSENGTLFFREFSRKMTPSTNVLLVDNGSFVEEFLVTLVDSIDNNTFMRTKLLQITDKAARARPSESSRD